MKYHMKMVGLFLIILTTLLLIPGCDESDDNNGNGEPDNPVPTITSITPDTGIAHFKNFTLRINGTNFVASSKISINGVEKDTTFISSNLVTAEITASDTVPENVSTGDKLMNSSDSWQIPVEVINPSPGGGTSNRVYYTSNLNYSFSEPRKLTPGNTDKSSRAAIAVDDNSNVYIVYMIDHGFRKDTGFIKSLDGGLNFSPPVAISSQINDASDPSIAAYGNGYVYAAWDELIEGNREILCAVSENKGINFSEPVNVSNNIGDSSRSQVAVDGRGYVYITWHDKTHNDALEIMISYSTDGGKTFKKPVYVSKNGQNSMFPAISFDTNNHVLLSWYRASMRKYNVFFSRSGNAEDFTIPVQISKNDGNSRFPKIAIDSNRYIHLFYHDDIIDIDNTNQIYYTVSKDNGTSFENVRRITEESYKSERPEIQIDKYDNINLIYSSDRNGMFEVFHRRSVNAGKSFTPDVRLSTLDGAQFVRSATGPDGKVYAVWHRRDIGYREIFFCRSLE